MAKVAGQLILKVFGTKSVEDLLPTISLLHSLDIYCNKYVTFTVYLRRIKFPLWETPREGAYSPLSLRENRESISVREWIDEQHYL